jgi:hypothetical protein
MNKYKYFFMYIYMYILVSRIYVTYNKYENANIISY